MLPIAGHDVVGASDHVARHQPANWFWIILGCKKRSELFFGSREHLGRVRIGVGHCGIMCDSLDRCKIPSALTDQWSKA